MNFLDIVLLCVILISIVCGIFKGFVRELIGLVFLAFAVYAAISYHQNVAKAVFSAIEDTQVASFLSFILIFFGILLVGSLIGYALKKMFIQGPMKAIDRMLGALFGVLRGVVIACVLLIGLLAFPINSRWVSESVLAKHSEKPILWVMSLLPDSMLQDIRKSK